MFNYNKEIQQMKRYLKVLTAPLAIVATIALTLMGMSETHGEAPKVVKLSYRNAAKVDIQVYTVDHVSKKTIEKKTPITPNGKDSSEATINKDGYIDITFSIVGKNDKNVSEYHCLDVRTSVGSSTTFSYDLTFDNPPKSPYKKC